MAKFFPEEQKEIFFENRKEILENLEKLDNSFEIFLNIFNNYRKADLTILKKWFWCFILNFSENEKNLENDLEKIKKIYYNFFNVYIEWLLEEKIKKSDLQKDNNIKNIINFWIIFIDKNINLNEIKNKSKFLKIFNKNFNNFKIEKNIYFTDQFYEKFKNFLIKKENINIKNINYTEKQQKLVFLKEAKNQKINWFPWSWKTIVLAWRAKNCLERNWWKVLVLTFNITLKKYIEWKISEIWWDLNKILVDNYHNFIWNFLKNEKNFLKEAKNEKNFKNIDEKYKFESILIDEVQDFEKEFIDIVRHNFLKDWWEFVVFWDSKQNIYERKMDKDKNPYTSIPWAWNKLDSSFRYENKKLTEIINNFQEEFLKNYENEKIQTQETLDFFWNNSYFNYFEFKKENLEEIFDKIMEIKNILNLKNKNICILATQKEILQELDYFYRNKFKEKTITTFESKEILESLKKINFWEKLKLEIYNIDRNKKIFFDIESDFLKFSTIQSFKWYELDTIILILENNNSEKNFETEEMIYTWISRVKSNLIVINLWNKKYKNFFEKFK